MGDSDRFLGRRDPPRESGPQGDAYALPDLLLDTVRDRRHQLLRVPVEHQDRGGVGSKELAGPGK